MTKLPLPSRVCPYPGCAAEYIPTYADQKRCPKCLRSLDARTVASAIARENQQKVRPKKRTTFNQVTTVKAARTRRIEAKPEAEGLTGREACRLARERMANDERSLEIPYPDGVGHRWGTDVGMD